MIVSNPHFMIITAKELSKILSGSVEGDPNVRVDRPSKIEDGGKGTISFLANPKYEAFAYTTTASILIVSKDFKPAKPISATLIRVDDVYSCVALLLNEFGNKVEINQEGISDQAFVHQDAKIGNNVSIGLFSVIENGASVGNNCTIYPQVYIGRNVKIGKNVTLHPGVKIYYDCVIEDHCILHSNVVIGSDGFGFAPTEDGSFKKIPQLGNVILEKEVEVGANTVVDRATMGHTIIKAGVKLDNLIQIGHNVEIGKNTVIAAQTGIAGSTKLGENCMIGGQVGIVGHITVANRTKVQAQSGIASKVKNENTSLFGSPALPYANYLRSYTGFKQLPELIKKINELEKQVKSLSEKSDLNKTD